ncbi:hypothetical protein UFOVP440_13 [uncultured Caudovirales phage]|uniref:Uncharacterized protein n=1 Tax=uncultured Caudovirales phage TaxID=2100421 RepID=A0A6J5M5E0_9CAUD|nr:hypothetical protein UFOVP440_13 [uncultured Caudovirales phage]
MAHYAFMNDDNIVTEVIVGVEENETIEGLEPEIWYGNFRGQLCKRTSYNDRIRFNYAGIGYTYDPIEDAFVPPMPNCGHEDLILNELKRWNCSNDEHKLS